MELGHHKGTRVLVATVGCRVHEVQDQTRHTSGLAGQHTPEGTLQTGQEESVSSRLAYRFDSPLIGSPFSSKVVRLGTLHMFCVFAPHR